MGFEDRLSEGHTEKLEGIKKVVTQLYKTAKGLGGFYVPHDESHCQKVEEYLDRIVPEYALDEITEEECFSLLCGIWLHDVGMIPQLFGTEDISDIGAVRKEHHIRSVKFVNENYPHLGLDPDEVPPVCDLCRYHRRSENLQDLNDEPRHQYLAALLRLADACHSDFTRTPPEAYRLNLAVGISSESLLHWVKSLIITKVNPDPQRGLIRLSVIIPPRGKWFNADFGKLTEIVVNDMQHELEGVKDYLTRHGRFTFSGIEVANVREVPRPSDDWGIYEALCAYEIPKFPSASQVFDIVLSMLDVIAKKAEVDKIKARSERALESAVKEKSHHLGLLRLKSDVEQACSDQSGADLREAICQCTERFRGWKTKAQNSIAEIAKENEFVSPGDCILVYSNSSCVRTLLKSVSEEVRETVEVYIGELRSKSTYDELDRPTYNDGHALALALAQIGYRVSLIADAAVPHFMAEGKIKKVITGTNGIGKDGSSSHPVGHLMVAESAKRHEIPFYVAGETFKMGTIEKVKEDMPNLWLCGSYEPMFLELSRNAVKVPRPKQDIVPADLITAFITEEGFLEPKDVKKALEA